MMKKRWRWPQRKGDKKLIKAVAVLATITIVFLHFLFVPLSAILCHFFLSSVRMSFIARQNNLNSRSTCLADRNKESSKSHRWSQHLLCQQNISMANEQRLPADKSATSLEKVTSTDPDSSSSLSVNRRRICFWGRGSLILGILFLWSFKCPLQFDTFLFWNSFLSLTLLLCRTTSEPERRFIVY